MLLYYITDRSQFPGDERARRGALLAKIREAACASVDYIQLREKDLSTRELEKLGRETVAMMQELRSNDGRMKTRLLINSRTDVAMATGADGVHLRSDDISALEVRSVWSQVLSHRADDAPDLQAINRKPVIAVSCHSASDVERAQSEGADFVVFAPVFEKKDAPATKPQGLAALREACRAKIPVLALGGITLENAQSCVDAGAGGIAGIRLFQENKIDSVVRALRAT